MYFWLVPTGKDIMHGSDVDCRAEIERIIFRRIHKFILPRSVPLGSAFRPKFSQNTLISQQ